TRLNATSRGLGDVYKEQICYYETADAFKVIMEAASNIGYDTENPYTHHGYVHVPGAKDPQLDICPQYV
ncbi:hypothetical protein V3C21_24920, partial [Salmonella enterica subsp. enterica serovar Paratyphi B]